jgi:phage-related protein
MRAAFLFFMATIQDVYELNTKADMSGLGSVSAALNGVKGAVQAVASAGTSSFNAIGTAVKTAASGIKSMGSQAKDTWETVQVGAMLAKDKISGIAGGIKSGFGTAASTVSNTFKSITSSASSTVNKVKSVFGTVSNAIASPFKAAASAVAAPVKSIVGAVGSIGKGLALFGLAAQGLQQVKEIVGQVTGALKEASPAFGSALGRVEERFTNFKDVLFRNIGDALAPILEKLADLLGSPAFTEFFNGFSSFVFGALKAATPLLDTIVGAVSDLVTFLTGGSIEDFTEAMQDAFGPDIGNVIVGIVGSVKALFDLLGNGDLEQFRETLTNALGPGLGNAVADAVKFVSDNWPKVQATFEAVGSAIGKVIGSIASTIGKFIDEHGPEIQAFLKNVVGKVGDILGTLYQIVMKVLTAIATFINDNQETIRAIFSTVWAVIQTTVGTVLNVISDVVNAVMAALNGDWDKAWQNFSKIFSDVWNGLAGIAEIAWSAVKGVVLSGINGVIDLINNNLIFGVNQAIIASNNAIGTSFKGLDLIPRASFANGAIVSSPVPAVIGDNPRSPEAVAPLSDLIPMIQAAVREVLNAGATQNFNLTVYTQPGQETNVIKDFAMLKAAAT